MVLLSFYLACIVLYDAILLLYQMSAINPIQYTIQYHKNVTVHVQGVHVHVLVVLSFFIGIGCVVFGSVYLRVYVFIFVFVFVVVFVFVFAVPSILI